MTARTVRIPRPEELEVFLRELQPLVPTALFEIAQALVGAVQMLYGLLEKRRYSLARLRRLLFGAKTEKMGRLAPRQPNSAAGKTPGPKVPRRKGKGHGRNNLKTDFPGAQRIRVPHPTLVAGCRCEGCGDGRMYPTNRCASVPRITGQAFLVMQIFEPEGWRCNACQQVVWAPLPQEAKGPKYDATAKSMLAVLNYANGMPFHRIEQHQKAMGIPVPQSVQWEQVSDLADKVAPVHAALIEVAARGEIVHNDDTHAKILAKAVAARADSEAEANNKKSKKPRTGTFTTGIVAQSSGHTIALFVTGHQHAGENLRDLLRHRPADAAPPIQMCDGLDHNCPAGFKTLLANCLAHGRRKIVDMASFFPQECLHVLEALKAVYATDALAKEQKLSSEGRLELHQEKSGPVLEELHSWIESQFSEKRTEPNSGLGQAFKYLLKRWQPLTLFLRVAGAPLDNNINERALKMAIRRRRNSLFYKTPRGAAVGDCLMSLIYTCTLAGVNSFDYLTVLQQHLEAVQADPTSWLPWNYKTTRDLAAAVKAENSPAASVQPPPQRQPGQSPATACFGFPFVAGPGKLAAPASSQPGAG